MAAALLLSTAALGCNTSAPPPAPKAPEVDVSLPVQESVTDYEIFTGSVQAEKAVTLQAQVTGYLLTKPLAVEGSDVKEGEVVFKIDPQVYAAILAQADATVNQTKATFQTDEDIYQRDVRSPIATPEATLVQDRDIAEAAAAAVKAAEATRHSAQINLDFTDIRAPFNGRISRRNVDPGNLIQGTLASPTSLATIVQLDPIYAFFDVDERTLLRIRKLVQDGKVPPSSLKGNYLPVNLALSDENGFVSTAADQKASPSHSIGQPRHPGVIKIVDNQENVQTGTLRMWGEFHNPDPKVLSPGMFARVQLPIGPPHPAILIAEAALVTDQGRQLLYVVGPPDDKGESEVSARYVTIGSYQDGLRVIDSGLKAGEQVVLNGLQRVRDKGKVRVRNVIAMPRSEEGAAPAAANEPGSGAPAGGKGGNH